MGERKIERQEREREREIGTETGVGERERRSDRGEREKITNTKNSWNFNLLCFNPITRDEVGKKEIEREMGWERERERERERYNYGGQNFIGGQKFIGGGTEMDQYLCDHHIKVYYNIKKRKFLAQFQF